MQTLKNRLQTLCDLVPRCALVADIGADHAHLTLELLRRGTCTHVLCTDLSPNSLQKAKDAVQKEKEESRVTFCLGDGLLAIDEYTPDAVVIAGMGGETIADILSAVTHRPGTVYLLQAMSRTPHLRRFLLKSGFAVETERLVRDDGRIYPIIKAVYDGKTREADELVCLCGEWALSHPKDAIAHDYLALIHRSFLRRLCGRKQANLETAEEECILKALSGIIHDTREESL